VLASLNYPNIAQLFGLEESSDLKALVMELVPGQTLDAITRRTGSVAARALPLDQALSIARQIADALEDSRNEARQRG
jgi:serine/threonine protein kinase